MNLMKNLIKKIITLPLSLVFKTKIGKIISDKFLDLSLKNINEIVYLDCKLKFVVPNWINRFRIDTFATKEPETLDWIGNFKKNSIFWDIGANVGLYTCYAAKSKDCKVFAFEPSIFNLELLGRNISANNLSDQVTIVPIPLTENLFENKLSMSTTEWGGSGSTFGQNYTHDGSQLVKKFDYKTIGLSMDQAISLLKIPQPDYIKIDVDGIEHLILKGGSETLKNVKSLLVEVDDSFKVQKENTTDYLQKAGFTLTKKTHSELFDNSQYSSCYNQIWIKK